MDALNPAASTPVTPPVQQTPAKEEKEAPAAVQNDSFHKTPVAKPGKLTGLWKAASGASKTLFAGFGLGSGAMGGFAIGGAVASTGNLLSGLFTHSLTMAGVTSAGLTGGIVGGVLFGVCGMLGGYGFGNAIIKGAHKIYEFAKDHIGK